MQRWKIFALASGITVVSIIGYLVYRISRKVVLTLQLDSISGLSATVSGKLTIADQVSGKKTIYFMLQTGTSEWWSTKDVWQARTDSNGQYSATSQFTSGHWRMRACYDGSITETGAQSTILEFDIA